MLFLGVAWAADKFCRFGLLRSFARFVGDCFMSLVLDSFPPRIHGLAPYSTRAHVSFSACCVACLPLLFVLSCVFSCHTRFFTD